MTEIARHDSPPRQLSRRLSAPCCATALAVCLLMLPAAGCFNAQALAEANSKSTDGQKLDRFDLGAFRITMPHLSGEGGACAVEFHAFGRVERRYRSEATKALKIHGPEIRAEIITSTRTLDRAALDDPALKAVREKIAEVVNGALNEKYVASIGFEQFEFYPL